MVLGRPNTPLGSFYRRKRAQLGAPKAITATARKLGCLIYGLIKKGQSYQNPICTFMNSNTKIKCSTPYANARTAWDSILFKLQKQPESHPNRPVSEKLQEQSGTVRIVQLLTPDSCLLSPKSECLGIFAPLSRPEDRNPLPDPPGGRREKQPVPSAWRRFRWYPFGLWSREFFV